MKQEFHFQTVLLCFRLSNYCCFQNSQCLKSPYFPSSELWKSSFLLSLSFQKPRPDHPK